MQAILSVSNLSKTYASGFTALKSIDLAIHRGEIFALLGPNGAGKTTLINIICGIVNASAGTVLVNGHDIVRDYRAARSMIGLVPQELTTDAFETVWATVSFSRGLFGKPANPGHIEKVLKALSLWDKKDNKIITLSGGMKRRLLIAKAWLGSSGRDTGSRPSPSFGLPASTAITRRAIDCGHRVTYISSRCGSARPHGLSLLAFAAGA